VKTQERIRESTHTKPLDINGKVVNAGSPTNPLTTPANTLSLNTNGSGSSHEKRVVTVDPNDANNRNNNNNRSSNSLNTIKPILSLQPYGSMTNLNSLNRIGQKKEDSDHSTPYALNFSGWSVPKGEDVLNPNGSHLKRMMAYNIGDWYNSYQQKGC